MKFVLNGGLILGTLDGANIEILEACGPQSCFIFGATADKVEDIRHEQRYPSPSPQCPSLYACRFRNLPMNPRLAAVIKELCSGKFGELDELTPLFDSVASDRDYYLVGHDFDGYLEAQARVDAMYMYEKAAWARASLISAARMGRFSSDRAISEYARDIWNVKAAPVPERQ